MDQVRFHDECVYWAISAFCSYITDGLLISPLRRRRGRPLLHFSLLAAFAAYRDGDRSMCLRREVLEGVIQSASHSLATALLGVTVDVGGQCWMPTGRESLLALVEQSGRGVSVGVSLGPSDPLDEIRISGSIAFYVSRHARVRADGV